ncbi:type III pantothenate kinase [Thauera butanivorans]|uniref:type III pantothenate kinase n=1 Tax=Thauera butanivorans TaxID=86174 RepID=UPI0008380976|nr:type III pantothenate kinase [Thauera butanivorans]
MILLIDAGNTRIKWRLQAAAGGLIHDEGAIAHENLAPLSRLRSTVAAPLRVVGSNVAGTETARRIRDALGVEGIEWLRPGAQACGVRNLYAEPGQLGADRWAALIGAHDLHAGACLVVMAGTATTVDLLSADGDFLGGLILPGVELMQQSLANGTAQLPLAAGSFAAQPRCTADAIRSGCLQAQAGAIERMFRQIAAQPGALCLLGGGAADAFADLLELPLKRFDNLVLHGLATVAAQPAGNTA